MSYSKWLQAQPKWFQDEALGRKKAVQFRDGKLKVERYKEHGKPLSLDELIATDDKCLKG